MPPPETKFSGLEQLGNFFGSTGGLAATGGLLGLVGGITGSVAANRAAKKGRRRTRKGIRQARTFADERVAELTGEGSLFALGTDFLRGTFEDGSNSPLAQDFVKQIRAAQASRGTLFGGAAVAAEAGGLAAFSQDLKSRLLPQLQSFAFAPEQLRQSVLGFEAPLRVAEVTGNFQGNALPTQDVFTSALNSAISGGFGGAQIGTALNSPSGGGISPELLQALQAIANKGSGPERRF